MIELSRHIERLLLDHDCVIVPGFGGFVAQYVPACWIESESLFFPPYRRVGFNPRLTLNDGLLVQSYMQAYDMSFPETQTLIEEAVSEMRHCLQENGVYELGGIGCLISKVDGCYEFEPCEAGVLSPELYGLHSFPIKTAEAGSADEKAADAKLHKSKVRKKDYTFHVNRELVNYVAAAVVALFFYFLWAVPLAGDAPSVKGEASFCSPVFAPLVKTASPAARPENAAVAEASDDRSEEVAAVGKGAYTIVLASAVSRKNADLYVSLLHEVGLNEAAVYVKRKMVRVVYGSYPSEQEAYGDLARLCKSNSVSEGWVMKLDK